MARPSSLPIHPRELVLKALRKSNVPMSAYSLLEKLKPHGVSAAPIIYRALEHLTKVGSIHKIRALNAFVACDCTADHHHSLSVLTVCDGCERVTELHDHTVIHQLEALRGRGVRLAEHAVIELPITCAACAA